MSLPRRKSPKQALGLRPGSERQLRPAINAPLRTHHRLKGREKAPIRTSALIKDALTDTGLAPRAAEEGTVVVVTHRRLPTLISVTAVTVKRIPTKL